MSREDVARAVTAFYDSLPFNSEQSPEVSVGRIRSVNEVAYYADLHRLLVGRQGASLLDVGCGAGWFANSVAVHYGLNVVGVDLCRPALERARAVSEQLALGATVRFEHLDLFDLPYEHEFFIVNSLGVLHHTHDCRRALAAVSRAVARDGFLHVGLYHKYGREPFLDLFAPFRESVAKGGAGADAAVEEAFRLYRALHRNISDITQLRSWFRDQVFHPHETQHTLQEVHGWLGEIGFELMSTSVNRFGDIGDVEALFVEERKLAEVSRERNHRQRVYFPGFFTILARRTERC